MVFLRYYDDVDELARDTLEMSLAGLGLSARRAGRQWCSADAPGREQQNERVFLIRCSFVN